VEQFLVMVRRLPLNFGLPMFRSARLDSSQTIHRPHLCSQHPMALLTTNWA